MLNDVSPQILLAFLNASWNRAAADINSFRNQLISDQGNGLALVQSGSLASVGKNSTSQAYKNYGPGSLTQVQIVEVYGGLIGLYDQVKGRVLRAFCDANIAVPADYDFDTSVYGIISSIFSAQCAGSLQVLPDITSIRIPNEVPLPYNGVNWPQQQPGGGFAW